MKRFFYMLTILGLGFAIGFGFQEIQTRVKARREEQRRHTAYATHPAIESKPFVVVLYSKEKDPFAEQNLLSALNQDYENFRIVYVDDGRGTAPSIVKKIEEKGTYIRHEKPLGSAESLYRVVHECKSNEVVVLLRGEESFSHSSVLDRLNRYFANPDVWAASMEEVRLYSYDKAKGGEFYHAFYAGLFQRIKLRDFLSEGLFKQEEYEGVIAAPLTELAGRHAYRVPEPLLLSPREKKQSKASREHPYVALKEYPWHDFIGEKEKVDMVVFSHNRPLQLFAFLESSKKYVSHLHRLFVIYRAGNDHYEKGYQRVKEAFPEMIYIRQSLENPYEDFTPIVQKVIFDRDLSSARYVAFALDNNLIKDAIDLQEGVCALKKTGAYGLYFRLGTQLRDHLEERRLPITEMVNAWQFIDMKNEWSKPNSIEMTLFRKEEIHRDFLCMKFHNPNILQALWGEHADLSQVGLYYNRSKAISLPLDIATQNEWVSEKVASASTKDLLVFFNQGLKIDIAPLDQIENEVISLDFEPKFVER